ncbi:hypothetical protein M0Q28_04480 [Patescibacteria group bacterium]|jgi:hypothetical protein|nr:hypothetical protein [Patescibacteria group bacterium]
MKQSQKNILLYGGCGVGIGILVTFGLVLSLEPKRLSKYSEPGSTYICVEDAAFDKSIKIPQSSVVVEYPSKGFLGMGARVIPGDGTKTLYIEPTESHVSAPPTETDPFGEAFYGLTFNVRVSDRTTDESFDSFVNKMRTDTKNPYTDYLKQGSRVVVNSNGKIHEYFTYHVGEDVEVWTAIAFGEKEIIEVSFAAKPTAGKESSLARGYVPALMREALTHISFE